MAALSRARRRRCPYCGARTRSLSGVCGSHADLRAGDPYYLSASGAPLPTVRAASAPRGERLEA